ncbi:hypothetical protein Btru_060045 [Bulinus truncatus]|nr:hypothetical protein Btru_060045 [Bulinus truncatus]
MKTNASSHNFNSPPHNMANRSRNFSEKSNASRIASGVADMEYFWSIELNSSKKSVTWIIKSQEPEEDDEDYIEHTLFLKMAILGSDAVKGEQNIVVLESVGGDGEQQKGAIVNLTRGESSMSLLDLTVAGKVGATFTLAEGSGPVIISGNHLLEYPKDDDLLDQSQEMDEEVEDSEDEAVEEEVEMEAKIKTPKRKSVSRVSKSKQKAKIDVDDDDDDDIDDDEEEDLEEDDDENDEDFEEETKPKKGKKAKETKKADKGKEKPDKQGKPEAKKAANKKQKK